MAMARTGKQLTPTGQDFIYTFADHPAIGMRIPAGYYDNGIIYFSFEQADIEGLEEFVEAAYKFYLGRK